MERRRFLIKSTIFLAGSLLGLNRLSEVSAYEDPMDPPKIALIIDDIGFSQPRARRFMDLGIPMTFSILPRLSKSYVLAEEIHTSGHEIMLHQPIT